jgi:glucose/arabinose dehydrogenase
MKATSFRPIAAMLTWVALTACDPKGGDPARQYGADPVLPEPNAYLLPPMSVPQAIGWKAGELPTVSAGLKVESLATGLEHPRTVYSLPNGDILVAKSNSPGTEALRPKDFIAGKVKGLAGAGAKGGNRITLLRAAAGDGKPAVRTVFIDHHWTKSMTASADGSKLYVGVGSNSNITENGMAVEEGRAAIYEVDRSTGAKRLFASGTRNPTSLAIEPQTHQLFAVVNERDEIGPDLVPDYLTSIREGGFYGWPYSYWGNHVDVRVQPQRPDLVAQAIKPDYGLSSHAAPLGLIFSEGQHLASAFTNGAFVGEHGSWDRSPLNGYQVIFVPFVNGRPVGKPVPVVTGFLGPDQETVHGRPVGLALDTTGALLIADDVGNTIWRVSATQPGT